MHKVLVICGPTATGKTTLAASLAKKFNGELISADSRQVYRGMDLVTGKERPDVPIWLYDVVDPDGEFSVSHWVKLAQAAVFDIQNRNKLPIVVGGTGLYIKALLSPFETIDILPNKKLRERLYNLTVRQLQEMIPRNNMNQSDWNNPRRLVRRIEIGKFLPHRHALPRGERTDLNVLMIGLTAQTHVLDARIEKRTKKRLEKGMQHEIDKLTKAYDRNLPAMSAIGLNEHAYARRQLTWFRKQNGIHWFDIDKKTYQKEVTALVRRWYTEGDSRLK